MGKQNANKGRKTKSVEPCITDADVAELSEKILARPRTPEQVAAWQWLFRHYSEILENEERYADSLELQPDLGGDRREDGQP